MEKPKLGFALCGSFCTFTQVIPVIARLKESGYDIIPIMSEIAYNTDTRFGKAADFIEEIEGICGNRILHTIPQTEPAGPQKLFDLIVIAPCTGNTLSKLANGITDSSVTMAVKGHLRNRRPVLLAISSNDALSSSAKNIGILLNQKHVYFVPMSQDDPVNKQASLVAHFEMIPQAVEKALKETQLQPVFA